MKYSYSIENMRMPWTISTMKKENLKAILESWKKLLVNFKTTNGKMNKKISYANKN